MPYEFASEIAHEQYLSLRIAKAVGEWRKAALRKQKANKAWTESGTSHAERDDTIWERYKSLEHLVEGLLGEIAALADEWNQLKSGIEQSSEREL